MYRGIIHQYRDALPVEEDSIITLNEGRTPLLEAPRLAREVFPGIRVYLKLEGLNPTGSFKDRGMTYAVSKAIEAGSQKIICASTGNTSAAAAAYAARAGIESIVLIPEGKIALGKLSQAMMHGAKVFQVKGNFDDALRMVKEVAQTGKITLVNSINPYRLMGQKTASYEIVEELREAPTYHAIPVGNAGNISAYWKGYQESLQSRKSSGVPIMLGFQAFGASPIVAGRPCPKPETVATAIRIGNPANWQNALTVQKESQGFISTVTDEEILKAYQMVAQLEGYFCEPASAVSIAGILKLGRRRFFQSGDSIVCTLTGHGLKDPDNAIKVSPKPQLIEANAEEFKQRLGV